jgi:hypothetical protein
MITSLAVISTRALQALPSIPELLRITKGLAALDAILCEDWESRYYSFNSHWDVATKAQMASMRNGSGDEVYILFSAAGVAIKGFAHEAFMSPFRKGAQLEVQHGLELVPGILTGFPDVLASFLEEPSFQMEETTFVVWRLATDNAWRIGAIAWPSSAELREHGVGPDGSEALLSPYEGKPEDYVAFAHAYFEKTITVEDAAHVLALRPLDESILERLGSERSLEELREDLGEIGYPLD